MTKEEHTIQSMRVSLLRHCEARKALRRARAEAIFTAVLPDNLEDQQ